MVYFLRQMTVASGNQLVECQECHNLYHQDCHKPQVTDKEVNDPRLVWYCARCTRQMKRMVGIIFFLYFKWSMSFFLLMGAFQNKNLNI